MLIRFLLVLAGVATVHCAKPAPHVTPAAHARERDQLRIRTSEELREAITPARSSLVAYHLTGASWAGAHPILVNRDYDFSIAMSMDQIGPAIAAGNRKKANDELAAILAAMPAPESQQVLVEAIRARTGEEGSFWSSPVEVALFGLLYGGTRSGPNARLQTILEVYGTDQPDTPLRFMVVSEALPLDGEAGWSTADGAVLRQTFRAATGELVNLANRWHAIAGASPPEDGETVECPLGDGEKLSVNVLEQLPARIIGTTERIPHTVIACPVPN